MSLSPERSPAYSGKLADPAFRRERARKAAAARTSIDHHIEKVIEAAPALTGDQLDRLRCLLPPVEAGVVTDMPEVA